MKQTRISVKVIVAVMAVFLLIGAFTVSVCAADDDADLSYGYVIPTDKSCKKQITDFSFSGDETTLYFMRFSRGKADAMCVVEIYNEKNELIRYYKGSYGEEGTKPFGIVWKFQSIPSGDYHGKCYTMRETTGETVKGTVISFNIKIDRLSGKSVTLGSATNYDGYVNVTWNALAGAEKYRVYRKKAGTDNGWDTLADISSKYTSYSDKTVKSGESYTYTVKAFDSVTKSNYDYKGVTTLYLDTPALVSAETYDYTGIPKISWKTVSGATSYRIYRKGGSLSNTSYSLLATVNGGSVSSYIDKTATSTDWTYTYTVRAFNGSYMGYFKNPGLDFDYMKAPTITPSSYRNGIKLDWNSAGDVAKSYRVYRYESGKWVLLGTPAERSFVDTNVKSGQKYTYTVKAVSRNNNGAFNKDGFSCTYMPTVKMLSLTFDQNGKATVKWEAQPNATGYKVYRKVNNGSWELLKDTANTSTAYVDSSKKTAGNTYSYTVRAYNKTSYGYHETGISKIYLAAPVFKVENYADASSLTGMRITWNADKNATHYRVYRRIKGESNYTCLSGDTKATSYWDHNPVAGKVYEYTVKTFRNTEYSSFTLTTVTCVPSTTVTSINVTSAGTKLTWNKAEGIKSYIIYRKLLSDGKWVKLATVTDTTYLDKAIASGATSKAYYQILTSDGTYTCNTNVNSCNFYDVPVFTATADTSKSCVTLNWKHAADSFTISRSVNGEKAQTLLSYDGKTSVTSFTDSNVTMGSAYTYTIKAVKNGLITVSKTVVAVFPLPVPTYTVSAADNNGAPKATILWNKVANATDYEIYRKISGESSWTKLAKVPASAEPVFESSIDYDTECYYSVKAVAADSRGSAFDSNGKKVMVLSPVPAITGIIAEYNTGNVTISWDVSDKAASYNIYRVSGAAPSNGNWGTPLVNTKNNGIFVDEGILPGTYTYTVVAVPSGSRSALTNNVGATVTISY